MMPSRVGEEPAPLPAVSAVSNVEAEAALLGALMIDNRLFGDIAETVEPRDFYEPLHQRVFEAIGEEISLGRGANPVTLRPFFVTDPAMKEVGGPSYLAQLTGSGAAVIGARDFAAQIRDLAKLRRIYDRTREIMAGLLDTSEEIAPAAFAARLEAIAFEESANDNNRSKTFSLADSIDRTVQRVVDFQTSGAAVGAIAEDIPEFTKAVGPLERQHLIILAGRPGMGKSALLCGLARSMAAGGYGVGVIELEMSDVDLGQRFAADVALAHNEPIKHATIRDAKLDPRELKVLSWCADQVRKMPIRLDDSHGLTLTRVRMKARQMKRELEAQGATLDVLFVDYLQLIHADRLMGNKVAEVTEVSKGLKELAKELDCAVVALSQLSRAVEQREDKRPQLSDLRESGSIEQDADVVCFLYREEYYLTHQEPDKRDKPREWEAWDIAMQACRDHLDLIVPKRRGGATGRAQCLFLRPYQAIRRSNFYADCPGVLFDE